VADAEARFVIDIDPAPGKSGAAQVGGALEKLKKTIEGGTKALQDLVAAAGRLKGSADVQAFERVGKDLQRAQNEAGKLADKVKALKEAGGAAAKIGVAEKLLEAARGRVTALEATREKLGQTEAVKLYKDTTAAITEKRKALAAAQIEMSRLGGTIKGTDERAKELAKTGDKIRDKFVSGMKWVVAGVFAGALAMGAFAAYAADSARSGQILREAATGSAAGAAALESRISGVLGKTAATRAEVQGLALELARTERVAGELDHALGAITTTSKVMGEQAGSIIKGLADRAVTARRFLLNPLDLKGTGLSFNAVAAQLGKQMGIATGAAAAALKNGQVKIQDGLKALDAAVETRFGALAKKQMLALPAQLARAKDNLLQLFTGVGLEGFLRGLQRVLGWLDQSTASGQKLKGILDKVFTPMGSSAMHIFPMVLEFLFGLVIGALKVYAAIRPIGQTIASWIGFGEGTGLDAAFTLGEITAYALTAALAVLVVQQTVLAVRTIASTVALVANQIAMLAGSGAAAAFGAAMKAAILPLAALAAAVIAVNEAVNQFVALQKEWDTGTFFRQVKSDLGLMSDAEREAAQGIVIGTPDAAEAIKGAVSSGEAIGSGLVSGMQNQSSAVRDAGAALASAASEGFTSAAEINSPSDLFRRHGQKLPEGVEEGVEEGTPGVSRAVAGMASPEPFDGSAGGNRGGTGAPVTVYAGPFYIGGDPTTIDRQGVVEIMTDILEDACRQAGLRLVRVSTS